MTPETRETHPSVNELKQALHGLLPDDWAEKVEQHLEDCPECLKLTVSLEADDTFAGWHSKTLRRVLVALAVAASMVLAGIVIKIATPHGTVVVEVQGKRAGDVRVTESGEVTLTDPNDGKEIRIAVDARKQQLVLTKAGFEAVGLEFNLRNPDGRRVKVHFEPLVASTADASSSPVETPAANVAIKPEPLPPIKGGEPLSPAALVQWPAKIAGVRSWSIETVKPRGGIISALYSADGKLVSVFSQDGSIRLLDATSGQLVRVLVGHPDLSANATTHAAWQAWSPSSQMLASSSISDNEVRLWDAKTGTLLRTWKVAQHDTGIPICWSPDGSNLAIASKGRLEIRNVANGKLLRSTPLNGKLLRSTPLDYESVGAAWPPDGKTIAIGAAGFGPCLVEAETLELRGPLLRAHVMGLAWSPDSKRLFMGIDGDSTIRRTFSKHLQGRSFESSNLGSGAVMLHGHQIASILPSHGTLLRFVMLRAANAATGSVLSRRLVGP